MEDEDSKIGNQKNFRGDIIFFLLVPALYFVQKYFAEYFEGKTFFIETREPLTF